MQEVREVLRVIPGSFQVAYPDRWINSIYLDGPGFEALQENLGGISQREKYRIRWYGDLRQLVENPTLEKKIKNNQLGTKEHTDLPAIDLRRHLDLNTLLRQHTPIGPALQPVVIVRYLRSYLVSQDQLVRATIDRHLEYYPFNGPNPVWHNPMQDPAVVLEIKYDQHIQERIDQILQAIPFRLTKNSKFVSGLISNWQ